MKNWLIIFLILLFASPLSADYTMPKGIPDPSGSFGVMDPIDDPAPIVNGDGTCTECPNWPTSASTDCYYIDKTHGSATNTDNPYGYPDLPRETPPEGLLQAGTVIYFHAGTYTGIDSAGDRFDWHGTGTAENPIWIVGNPITRPIFQDYINISEKGPVSYLVIDSIELSGIYTARLGIKPGNNGDNIDHVVVRNCILTGTQNESDSSAISISLSSSGDSIPDSTVNYTVIYNNTISNFGDETSTDEAGVYTGFHTSHTWILGNTIHDVGADAVAGSHYSNNTTLKTEHYYIGGNTMYSNGENGIDLKAVKYFIISENIIYGPHTRENGWAMSLHYGASPSISVKNGWVIFNKMYDCGGGIVFTDADDMNVIGNIGYNLHGTARSSDPVDGAGVGFRSFLGTCNIVDNTFYDYDNGVVANQTLSSSATLNIHGNIFSNRDDASGFEIRIDGGEEYASIDYNQYYYPTGSAAFDWNSATRDLTYMQGTAGECANGQEGNPLLVNPPTDLSLQSGSPCKNQSTEHSVYDAFYTEYSINIERDFDSTVRPQESIWDMGAYEYVSSGTVNTTIQIGTGDDSITVGTGNDTVTIQ